MDFLSRPLSAHQEGALPRLLGDSAEGGTGTDAVVARFNRRATVACPLHDAVSLRTTRNAAAGINAREDARLPGPVYPYHATVAGYWYRDEYPTDAYLELRVGFRVMLLCNA